MLLTMIGQHMKTLKIAQNGTFKLNNKHSDANSIVCVSGDLGTATVNIVYKKLDGSYENYTDGSVVSGEQARVSHGSKVTIYAQVTGSNGSTDIEILCAGSD